MKTKSFDTLVGQINYDNDCIKSLLVGIEVLAVESREDDIVNLALIAKEYSENLNTAANEICDSLIKLEK